MFENVVSVIFVLAFILCGCSLDGFFDSKGNALMTLFCLAVTIGCGYIICDNERSDK
jgi:hypothetical protein